MKDLSSITITLKEAPQILQGLLDQIPDHLYKERRIPGKWSIHEHVCHLDVVQDMILERFRIFLEQESPVFQSYRPGENVSDADLIHMDIKQSVVAFQQKRMRLLEQIQSFDPAKWHRNATHPQYTEFTPYIFLRHVTMHDHLHMYRMEELWLSKEEYLKK